MMNSRGAKAVGEQSEKQIVQQQITEEYGKEAVISQSDVKLNIASNASSFQDVIIKDPNDPPMNEGNNGSKDQGEEHPTEVESGSKKSGNSSDDLVDQALKELYEIITNQ